MPPVLWLVALPIGGAPVLYLLRRIKLGALLAVFTVLFLAWLAIRLPPGAAFNLLGRPVELDHLAQIALALVFVATAILFLIPIFVGPFRRGTGHSQTGDGDKKIFYPVSLAILGLFVAASLSRHLGITAIFIEVAAIFAVFVIQGERLDSTRSALRFLTLMTLATPLFLLAAWRIDLYLLSSEQQLPPDNLEQIALFLGFGFALWLAIIPFHGWMTSVAAESSPTTAAFILIVFPIIAFSLLIHLLADWPWLANSNQLIRAIIIAGVFTALVGGALASVQRGFSELMGYAALYDIGCSLAILGIGGQAAVITIMVALTVRALALTLLAASVSTIRILAVSDGFSQIAGIAWHMPMATIGLVVGGLTLAGVPFVAGFAPHWQLVRSITEIDPNGPILIVLAGLGITIGYLRGLRAALSSGKMVNTQTRRRLEQVFFFQEPRLILILISLLVITSILLGIFPSLLIEPLQQFTPNISIPIG